MRNLILRLSYDHKTGFAVYGLSNIWTHPIANREVLSWRQAKPGKRGRDIGRKIETVCRNPGAVPDASGTTAGAFAQAILPPQHERTDRVGYAHTRIRRPVEEVG